MKEVSHTGMLACFREASGMSVIRTQVVRRRCFQTNADSFKNRLQRLETQLIRETTCSPSVWRSVVSCVS